MNKNLSNFLDFLGNNKEELHKLTAKVEENYPSDKIYAMIIDHAKEYGIDFTFEEVEKLDNPARKDFSEKEKK